MAVVTPVQGFDNPVFQSVLQTGADSPVALTPQHCMDVRHVTKKEYSQEFKANFHPGQQEVSINQFSWELLLTVLRG